jgi:hypothetical protein
MPDESQEAILKRLDISLEILTNLVFLVRHEHADRQSIDMYTEMAEAELTRLVRIRAELSASLRG